MPELDGSCKAPSEKTWEEKVIHDAAPFIGRAAAVAAANAAVKVVVKSAEHPRVVSKDIVKHEVFNAAVHGAEDAAVRAASHTAVEVMKNAVKPQSYDPLEQDSDAVLIVVVLILLVWLGKNLIRVFYQCARDREEIASRRRQVLLAGWVRRPKKVEPSQNLDSKLLPSSGPHRFKGMQPIPHGNQISLSFESLGLSLKSDGKCIMKGVTGSFVPGRMASIMGPSGAGKTTLLNTLCGKAPYGNITGTFFINGMKAKDTGELKSVMGFVPQDDIVHEDLTPYEQLLYNVRLRNRSGIAHREARSIVKDIVNIMQLDEVQDTIVGNDETRGISGGQRKRVNIGLELAARPRILFLDEPTSGLDSSTALSIISSLEQLAKLGMTIVMVVHQPRYSLFELFDDVLLLGKGGRTVYSGPATYAKPYLETLGHRMPQFENPADWLMDVISSDQNKSIPEFKPLARCSPSQSTLSSVSLSSLESCTVKSSDTEEVLSSEGSMDNGDVLPVRESTNTFSCSESSIANFCPKLLLSPFTADNQSLIQRLTSASDCKSLTDDKPGFSEQLGILVSRSLLKWWRQSRAHLMCQMFILISALVVGALSKGEIDARDPEFALDCYTAQVILSILVAVTRIRVFGNDKPLFYRESASGIRVMSVYMSKILWDTIEVIVETLIFICGWYISSDTKGSLSIFLPSFLLVSFIGAGWGYFLSTLVPRHNSVLATVATMMIACAAVSSPSQILTKHGVSLFQDRLLQSSVFTWSTAMCYARAVYEAGGCAQAGPCCDVMSIPGKEIFSGYFHLTALQDEYFHQQRTCFSVLLLFTLALYIAGYFSLKYKNRDKQV